MVSGSHSNESLSDIEVIKDAATFKVFFMRYANRLYKAASQHVDSDTAEDIVQDLMIEVWNKRHSLTGNAEGSLQNYMFLRLKFMVFDYYSKKPEQALWEEVLPELMHLSETHVMEEMVAKELEQIIYATLQEMQPSEQEVFRLRWEQQLSVAETAELLGISPKSVMNRFNLALKAVRNNINGYYQEETAAKYQFVLLFMLFSGSKFL